jgi:hypothetical protein
VEKIFLLLDQRREKVKEELCDMGGEERKRYTKKEKG